MELNQLQEKILAPFVDRTVECLKNMAGLKAVPGTSFEDDVDAFWANDYAVVVETSGLIEGRVVMHIYLETALEIGRNVREFLLGEHREGIDDIDEEVIEALSEFSNTVVGLATRELAESDLCVVFEPPVFVSDMEEAADLFKGVKEVITVPIHVEGIGRFYLNYFLLKETEM
jgi:CheY-specific phosphatase CheX